MALPHKTKIPVGTVLVGKYRITREIGRGGMAAVYEAENIDIGKRIAIKVLAQELTSSAIVVERFLREARAAAAIRSPYICDVYDSGRLEDGPPFLVLELLEGESLYEKMTKVRYLDVDTTVIVLTQTCRGLTKAHAASIVHRDLKPENIFITKDEEGALLAKILDFGLAKFYAPLEGENPKQARLTREGAVFGTPAYMSPEQVRGQGAVDHRADLWALGCIAYECLTGKTVWATDQGVAMTFAQIANAPLPNPQALRADLPNGFTTWFHRALDRNIEKRFQTAKEFSDGLIAAFQSAHPSYSALRAPSSVEVPLGDLGSGATIPAPPSAPVPPSARPAPMQGGAAYATQPQSNEAIPPPSQPIGDMPRSSKHGFVAPPPTPSNGEKLMFAPPPKGGLGRTVVIGGGIALALALGLAAWFQFADAGGPPLVPTSASASAMPSGSAGPTRTGTAVDGGAPPAVAWLAQVRDAQQAIANDDLKGAAKLLKDAFDKGGSGVPRTMSDQLNAAMVDPKQACRLNGLARPRTFDLTQASVRPVPAGRPSIVIGPKGPVMTWTDAHEGAEHAYTVLLDAAMRPIGDPTDVTPEATAVGRPDIQRAGDKLVLTYWDAKGADAGVKVRFLEADGHIGGQPMPVGPVKGGNFWPSLARAPDGTFFVGWTEEGDGNSEDLFLRHLKPTLEPASDTIRATDLVPGGPTKPRIRWPGLAIEGGSLQIAFRYEKDPTRVVEHIRLPLADAGKGLDAPKPGKPRGDRFIGDLGLVNTDKSKADAPTIACGKGACYVAWQGEQSAGYGGWIAFIDPAKSAPVWHKKFSKTGTHPGVAVSPSGAANVVWFEQGKINIAAIQREAVDAPSKFARISSEQPTPSIIAGEKPGEWYVAWLDYEAGHLEAYGARLVCK